MFNLEEVDRTTQCFSEMNLLAKNNILANYRGILRDGSIVVIKCIAKTSCKSDETEFLNGLKILTSLKNENLVRLRGFCCSKSRGECFLVYDFVSNGSLSKYLDVQRESAEVLEWSTRVSIIHGIAKGNIFYASSLEKFLIKDFKLFREWRVRSYKSLMQTPDTTMTCRHLQ